MGRSRDYRDNSILARGLVTVAKDGQTIVLRTTPSGAQAASQLVATQEFADVASRASTLHTHLDLQATNLMRFIYETFPEVVSLRKNEEIDS